MGDSMWIADLGNGNFRNPILYADYSDPDAIRVGDDYFMVASSFSNSPALPLLHSKDLVNWKVVNYICEHVPEDRYFEPVHGCGVWAPAIRYHEGTYFVCFPMPDEGIYMSSAKDPFGTWTEPVNIRPGAGWIDPCPFWDEDGKAYLVAGVAKSRIGYKSVLHMVEMQPDGMGLIGEEVKIFDGNLNDQVTIEGPKMYKRNGYYYVFAPAGGVKCGWQTVLRSKHPFGPYEYKVVLRQGDSEVNGPHQGAWVDTQTGEDWFLHFQDVYAAGRITHLQPMHWENDWPIIGVAKEGNDYGEPVMEYKKPDVGASYPICEPDTSDEFDRGKLGLQWQWNANYENSWYDFDTDRKCLKLYAVKKEEGRKICDIKNLLLQKWPAPEFSCVAKMNFSHLAMGDMSGIVSMGMSFAALAVQKTETELIMMAATGKQNFGSEGVSVTQEMKKISVLSSDTIYFKYILKNVGTKPGSETPTAPAEKIILAYSTDGEKYEEVIETDSLAGRWVGVKNGMFACCNSDSNSGGYAAVEYFRYFK